MAGEINSVGAPKETTSAKTQKKQKVAVQEEQMFDYNVTSAAEYGYEIAKKLGEKASKYVKEPLGNTTSTAAKIKNFIHEKAGEVRSAEKEHGSNSWFTGGLAGKIIVGLDNLIND